MATAKSQRHTIRRLNKQLNAYKRKEKSARNKLRAALSKVKTVSKNFERKLESRSKEAKAKVNKATSAIYLKLANSIKMKARKSGGTSSRRGTISHAGRGKRR